MKLFTIIQKNFKIFSRSKVSALIIFLGPLLLVSLIGMSFSNTRLPGLTVGTYSPNYNDFTNSITAKIEENKFQIDKFDTEEKCSNAVKKGDIAICLLFPKDMDKTNNEITFVVDYSKINLVWIVVDIFSTQVSERSNELRTNYVTDILTRVVQTKDDLSKEKTELTSLKENQDSVKTTLDGASETLNEMTVNTDFGTDVTVAAAKSSIESIKSILESAETKITSSKTEVSNSGISVDVMAEIIVNLNSALSSLSSASIYLEGNSSVDSLEYMVTSLNSALSNAKAQLNTIKQKKSSLSADIISLGGSIDKSIKSAEVLNSAVLSMIERISSIQISDTEQIVSPIRTKIDPVSSPETHFNYLFPTLLVLVIMITAILLSSTLVMNEKKSKSVFRNFITPTANWVFNLGTFVSSFSAILVQLVIFLLVSMLFFDTNILNSFGSTFFILILIMSVFILLGMIIGYVFKSEETYVLGAITISALLLFLSSTVMPLESISDSIRMFASYTPFVVSENLLRQAMFFNFGIDSLFIEMIILVGYLLVFYGIIVAIQNFARMNVSIAKRKEEKK